MTLTDVSDTKRRRSMERIFFHDITNIAGSLKGYFDMLAHDIDVDQLTEMLPALQDSLNQLMGEIQSQRSLTLAENGELQVEMTEQHSREVLESVAVAYRRNEAARGRTVVVDAGCASALLRTDPPDLRALPRWRGELRLQRGGRHHLPDHPPRRENKGLASTIAGAGPAG